MKRSLKTKLIWVAWGLCLITLGFMFLLPSLLPGSCILEGTLIDTPSGSREIESLTIGDGVWTRAPDGSREVGSVAEVFEARVDRYLEISLADGGVLEVTALHPIAVRDGWREAGDLVPGDLLRGREGWREITAISERLERVTVFDLQVEPNPNFYAAGVLVHNKTSVEHMAGSYMKTLATAQADFRFNDRDGNKIEDYWIRDVAELYHMESPDGSLIKCIDISLAQADPDALNPRPDIQPKYGIYWFAAIPIRADGQAYGSAKDPHRSTKGFAFCAWPANQDDRKWRTFIINEENNVYRKDAGTKRIVRWPSDPESEGWERLN